MKKKFAFKLIALALAAATLSSFAACSNGGDTASTGGDTASTGDTSGDGSTDNKFAERVALDVCAFVGQNEADGLRSDPVSKYIEEQLNIDLYLTGVTESDWPNQLATMMAGQDLPDIFLLSNPTEQLSMLLASNSALNMSPYLEEYAPNTMADPGGQLMITANTQSANSPDGNLYLWGMCKGSWDDGTVPTCGHYIRWDLYKEAGYPTLENFDEDMLDVMEAMVALEPETADGQKTYGLGCWFGAGQGWGEWFFTFGMAPQEGANLIESTGRVLGVSTVDSTPLETNQLTDKEGYFWRAVKFANKANQRGLLDPDSFTMTSDTYEENLKAGKYMFNYPGWMSTSANNEFAKTEGNTKMFISLPAIGADAEDRFGNMYRGERQYAVNGQTKNPERCVALLDFVSTYDFSRITFNGLEGTYWNMEDGVAVPTDEFLTLTLDDAEATKSGVNVYGHFMGYGNGAIDPDGSGYMDLYQFSDKAKEAKMNETLQDFIDHYGAESQVDVYRQETETTNSQMFISFGEPDDEISNYVNEINAYVGTTVFTAVAATSDEEFQKIQDEMISTLQNNYHVDEVFEYFYNEAVSQEGDVAVLSEMSNEMLGIE